MRTGSERELSVDLILSARDGALNAIGQREIADAYAAALEELTELRRMLRRWMVWAASEEQDEETHGEEFMSIWFDTESLGIVLEQLDAVEASRTPTPEEK